MERISEKQLKSLIEYVNELTASPKQAYSKQDDGTYKANIGNYHLDCAYGGYNLARICSDGGGISQPLGGGYHTKRELYNKLHAFIRGIDTGKKLSNG
jgi:hypothetical protein